MAAVRTCTVSISDLDKMTHSVEVQAETLFEAVAAAVAAFRQHSWGSSALTPAAVLRVEVQAPTVVHMVPLTALERWQRSPSTSPKELLAKRTPDF